MSDLREAVEWWDEYKGFLWQRLSDNDWAYIDRGFAAARRFLALTETVHDLRQAITNEGPKPRHHREIMERHRQEWPTLWAAIDRLIEDPPTP